MIPSKTEMGKKWQVIDDTIKNWEMGLAFY